ncbi:hypothetical protein B0H10DRAFT_2231059 [Mycena sp. CBHHK59/15]|nr:hypothetical protein B0H10DRAFT_1960642 [Mycena sp. CBHHK59/15]KAJ6600102.1 hypothetical protein B0H10DRAFT_2231059 [Mycena sp. CBHHK59/15]
MHKEVTLSETTEGCVPTSVVTAWVKLASLGKVEWEVASLNTVLNEVVQMREDLREGMHIIFWCEWLLELASERAEQVGQCSWDKQLCFDKNQWADFGEGVLESYEDGPNKGIDSMEADYPAGEDWWCLQSQKCECHTGWQALRDRDLAQEREKKEEALFRLTTRERKLRKRINNINIVQPFQCS